MYKSCRVKLFTKLNGIGNIDEYWDLYEKYPNLQGGYIWDWTDQSLEIKTPVDKILKAEPSFAPPEIIAFWFYICL